MKRAQKKPASVKKSRDASASSEDPRFAAMVAELKRSRALREVIDDYDAARLRAGGSFGKHALRAAGKIFAMMAMGRLVLKLPQTRVDALIAAGDGAPFDANKGKPMKQWVAIRDTSTVSWSALAREAHAFVAG